MVSSALHTEQLSKTFGNNKAIDAVDFTLGKGEIHAVIGANGAGKSTFVKLLYGEVIPTSGKIFIEGKQVRINKPSDAIRNRIAMVSQDFGLIDTMSITDNLSLNNVVFENHVLLNPKREKANAVNALAILSLQLDVTQRVEDLSISEKQLVAIAKAIVTNPDIIIFDEPTSVLDTATFQKVKHCVDMLKGAGKSIIYITHKIEEVFQLADTVSVFRDGEIALTAAISQVSEEELQAFFSVPTAPVGKRKAADNNRVLLRVEKIITPTLHDVSFLVREGEIVAITSDNFNEALELGKVVCGFQKITSGCITINNRKVSNSPYKNLKCGLGVIPADRRTEGIFPNLSVHDNIAINQLSKWSTFGIINQKALRRNSEEMVAQLGIRCQSIFQLASELSGGNQQKVLFARWMSSRFDLLILAEPTAGIDLKGKAEIHSLINALRTQGKSFVLVSSDDIEVKKLADRIIVVEKGTMRKVNSNDGFSKSEAI